MTKVELTILVDKLINIKDKHRNVLSIEEVETLNAACNLIDHNLDKLKD